MKIFFFQGNKIKVLLHLLAWTLLLGLPLYFYKRWEVGNDFMWLYYINTIISGVIFYINYFALVPRFFFDNRRHRYFLSVLVLLILFYVISDRSNEMVFKYVSKGIREEPAARSDGRNEHGPPHGLNQLLSPPPFRQIHLYNYTFSSVFLIFFSLGLRVLEKQTQIEKIQKELEKERLNSELALLKNQISPHFFFNTLNNIYSLIGINAEDSKKAVLTLSKLMRYLLYESETGNTMLSNELAFMNNYIDLMKLRVNEKIKLSISFPDKYDDISIPPLLFIPFIENAFKHGISYREKSFIEISMLPGKDSLTFRCCNSIVRKSEDADKGHSGIGLENVSKRLMLLFPGKHELKISTKEDEFEVLLFINFA